jgi:hypothetical protein
MCRYEIVTERKKYITIAEKNRTWMSEPRVK